MVKYSYEDTEDPSEEQAVEQSDMESTEEGFVQGYSEDDEVLECAECGGAVKEEKKIVRQIEEESYTFCSKDCADEFEESVKEE